MDHKSYKSHTILTTQPTLKPQEEILHLFLADEAAQEVEGRGEEGHEQPVRRVHLLQPRGPGLGHQAAHPPAGRKKSKTESLHPRARFQGGHLMILLF